MENLRNMLTVACMLPSFMLATEGLEVQLGLAADCKRTQDAA